jgi:hypothetical protein
MWHSFLEFPSADWPSPCSGALCRFCRVNPLSSTSTKTAAAELGWRGEAPLSASVHCLPEERFAAEMPQESGLDELG